MKDESISAVARLSEGERVCLRRRLSSQTAKEIARDLGISPHAVEKRLKMARTKLRVSSSLEAARLLASAEGSQPLVPRTSELEAGPSAAEKVVRGDDHQRRARSIIGLTAGVFTMSILAAAILIATGAGPDSTPQAARYKATPEQARAFLTSSFATMDRDKSGAIELAEAPGVSVRPLATGRDEPLRRMPVDQGRRMWIAQSDSDGDGKVGLTEWIARFQRAIEANGVPANWRPRN